MQLKHLNLTTSDVSGLATFFERFVGFKRLLERGSGAFTILGNDEDFVLTLMKPKKHDPSGFYPETFHVGFYVDDAAAVHTKHDELAAAGLSPGEIRMRTATICAELISIAPLPAMCLSKSPRHLTFNNEEAAQVGRPLLMRTKRSSLNDALRLKARGCV